MRLFLGITLNYLIDYFNYIFQSGIFTKNTETKLLAFITFTYHTLEKGFSMPSIRLGFGKKKVRVLIEKVSLYIDSGYNVSRSQFIAACSVLKKYYDLHKQMEYNIHPYFTGKEFNTINKYANEHIGGAIECSKKTYFPVTYTNYSNFVRSRHSIRNFTETRIDLENIKRAVELANHCPSACNRQSSKVYLINMQQDVDAILKIQQGVLATADKIHQLLVVTSNRNYFFTSGERNQLFVDGGIFLESLLLSLHNEQVGSCTLHWSLNNHHDKEISSILGLSKSEKVIALIAIGNIENDFKVPFSHRKEIDELLVIKE
jgi:nitroreductase